MPPIVVSAVISDGAAVLFELQGEPVVSATYALPRFAFGEDEDSIEESLARQLAREHGIEIEAQEFVDTLYERSAPGAEVRLNNLQLVTAWQGTPPEQTASGARLVWVPLEALGTLDLPGDLWTALLTTFGLAAPREPVQRPGVATGRVIVVTGPAGAGKSTVARLICEFLARAALVELDALWHMVRSGKPVPAWEGGDAEAGHRFERLAFRNAAALARNFTAAGYVAVVEGMFEQPAELDLLLGELQGIEVYFTTLMPDPEELWRRDQGRPAEQRMGERSRELHGIFSFNGELRGLHLDTTGLSPEETAHLILAQLEDARVL